MTSSLIELVISIRLEDCDEDHDDEDSPQITALELMDTIAMKMPEEEVMSFSLSFSKNAKESKQKEVALHILGITSEGCADTLNDNIEYLFDNLVSEALQSTSLGLVGAGLYAGLVSFESFSKFCLTKSENRSKSLNLLSSSI